MMQTIIKECKELNKQKKKGEKKPRKNRKEINGTLFEGIDFSRF